MKMHRLKIWPQYFVNVKTGRKTFEIRKDDREFETGDILDLEEYDPVQEQYTGYRIAVYVSHIQRNEPAMGIPEGYCIMSIRKIAL